MTGLLAALLLTLWAVATVRLALARPDPVRSIGAYTKRTLLWGSFRLPARRPVAPVATSSQGSWLQSLGGKSAETKYLRSLTPCGFARAFAAAQLGLESDAGAGEQLSLWEMAS